MKKKKLTKSLNLNKQKISNLEKNKTTGGITIPFSAGCLTVTCLCDIIVSIANGTKGDCVETWGDPGCPSGIDGICIA